MKYLRTWVYNFGVILGCSAIGVGLFLTVAFSIKWLVINVSPVFVFILVILVVIGVLATIITPKK